MLRISIRSTPAPKAFGASLRGRVPKTQPGWGSTNTACGAIAQAAEQRVRNAKIGARLPVAPPAFAACACGRRRLPRRSSRSEGGLYLRTSGLRLGRPISRPVCEQQNRRSVKPLPSGLHWCKSNPADHFNAECKIQSAELTAMGAGYVRSSGTLHSALLILHSDVPLAEQLRRRPAKPSRRVGSAIPARDARLNR